MNSNVNEDQEKLKQIITVFSDTACASVQALFSKDPEVENAWSADKHMEIKQKYILIMGGASDIYQSILTIGIDVDTIIELLGQELSERDFSDTFGELANTFCGLLMDNTEFTDRFGILNQTVPVLYTKGIPFLPFIFGVQGYISINGKKIFIGFAIRKKN
jgi:hypothetical protein